MADETIPPAQDDGVAPIAIETELKRSYLDYAMSVIVSRALPDARDGLKPVHRRILYSMNESNGTHDKPYRKSAKFCGDVMGKYHPHGDGAIYDAMVRLAQDFSMGVMLLDGQGNFGSMDGDPPAAQRYTEIRMAKIADWLLADIDKDTVDFQPNYDGQEVEPTVLPARFPNLLVNGAEGIAVGMATKIPTHNLHEVVSAALALLENGNISDHELLDIVPGPDFPTGGEILGRSAARNALLNGRGSVMVRAVTRIENISRDREAIIVDEIPYQVNKKTLVERIAELVREKRVEGISALRDETNRHGVRIVIEVKRDASPDIVLNQLFRHSQLQVSFSYNVLAIDAGRPVQMGLRRILEIFLSFREQVITRRTRYELNKARDRAHELVGLAIAVANIDEVIATIRRSANAAEAREALLARTWPAGDLMSLIELVADRRTIVLESGEIRMSDQQVRRILELQLSRLTNLGRDEINNDAERIGTTIRDLLEILGSRDRILGIIKEELEEVRTLFGVPRKTKFVEGDFDLDDEALIEVEDMVVTMTHGGYVKRTPVTEYRAQRRGGKGRAGMATRDEDYITRLFVASTHSPVLFFSSDGQVYKEKVWRLPQGDPRTRGKALVNMLPLSEGERITSVMALPEDEGQWDKLDVMFATRSGTVRRNRLSDFVNVNRAGKIAMKLDEGDGIVDVRICTVDDDVLLTTALGRCIRFAVDDVRVFKGRDSTGVRGIKLESGDSVISMAILLGLQATPNEARAYLRHANAMRSAAGEEPLEADVEAVVDDETDGEGDAALEGNLALSPERIADLGAREQFVLTVSNDGFGRRSSSYDYRQTGRGGKGIIARKLPDAQTILSASFPIEDTDDLLLVSDGAQLIRMAANTIRIASRPAKGVKLITLGDGERVVGVERLAEVGGDGGEDDVIEADA
jgi:DNA gyrase subunit A